MGRGFSEVNKVGISNQVSCMAAADTTEDGEDHHSPFCTYQRIDSCLALEDTQLHHKRGHELVASERTLLGVMAFPLDRPKEGQA